MSTSSTILCNHCYSPLSNKFKIKFSLISYAIQFIGGLLALTLWVVIMDLAKVYFGVLLYFKEKSLAFMLICSIPGLIIFLMGFSMKRNKVIRCYSCGKNSINKITPVDRLSTNFRYIFDIYNKFISFGLFKFNKKS
jgi:hypothetical protein